jgi:hypothetical protein
MNRDEDLLLDDEEAVDEREVLVDDCCFRLNEDPDDRLTG